MCMHWHCCLSIARSSRSAATMLLSASLSLLLTTALAVPAIPHPCHFATTPRTVLIPDGPGTTGWVWTEPVTLSTSSNPPLRVI